jgi:hypothetical protein
MRDVSEMCGMQLLGDGSLCTDDYAVRESRYSDCGQGDGEQDKDK